MIKVLIFMFYVHGIYGVNFICENNSYKSHGSDCGSYYICNNGYLNLMKCPNGLLFDEVLHICSNPDVVNYNSNYAYFDEKDGIETNVEENQSSELNIDTWKELDGHYYDTEYDSNNNYNKHNPLFRGKHSEESNGSKQNKNSEESGEKHKESNEGSNNGSKESHHKGSEESHHKNSGESHQKDSGESKESGKPNKPGRPTKPTKSPKPTKPTKIPKPTKPTKPQSTHPTYTTRPTVETKPTTKATTLNVTPETQPTYTESESVPTTTIKITEKPTTQAPVTTIKSTTVSTPITTTRVTLPSTIESELTTVTTSTTNIATSPNEEETSEPTVTNPWDRKCPPHNDGYVFFIPHEDCDKYYVCNWSEKVEMLCPDDLHFNPILNVCDWPWDANCVR